MHSEVVIPCLHLLEKVKRQHGKAWNVFENATEVFHCLSSPCDNLTQSEIGVLEECAVIMYDQSSSTNKVNDASLDLFARKQHPYNGIPPSRAALVEHIKRSVLQAGHTWGQSLCKSPTLPSPSRWGWEKDSGVWVPHWTSLASIAALCQELLKCGCRISCSGNCKCFRSGLPCTALCGCNCSEFRSFASYKTTTACILVHVQWTYIWNDALIVCWTPFWLIISKEIEMLQKKLENTR